MKLKIVNSKGGLVCNNFSYQYDGKTLKYSVCLNNDVALVKSIIFLGTVQIGKLPAWIAEKCPQGTLVVQGAPHWFAKADGSDTPEFVIRFTREVFDKISVNYQLDKQLSIIADSQAAPAVLRLLSDTKYSDQVAKLVLIQPLGLNMNVFEVLSNEQRLSLFKKRINKNLLHQIPSLLSDRRLVYNHWQLFRMIGRDTSRSDAQYSSGLIHDAMKDLVVLSKTDTKIAIICGENDKIFPSDEIKANIDSLSLDIPVVLVNKTPHSPLATRHGTELLNSAFALLSKFDH